MSRASESAADRVLVLTPTGRDAKMLCQRIVEDGMRCEVCADLPALLAGLSSGAGVAVIAQEALTQKGAAALVAALEAQEPWSDIPVLFLSEARSNRPPSAVPAFLERANITILQRPLTIQHFLSGVRSAVRARRRQYQMRDLYRDLERAVQLGEMFVGILGHDLRTPLGAIKMSAELIVRGIGGRPSTQAGGAHPYICRPDDENDRAVARLRARSAGAWNSPARVIR